MEADKTSQIEVRMMDRSGLPCGQREGCFLDNPIKIEHQLLVDLLSGISESSMDYCSSILRKHCDIQNKMHRSINFSFVFADHLKGKEHISYQPIAALLIRQCFYMLGCTR